MIRVGVVGASGLSGGELLRIIGGHPDLELTFLGGSSSVGKRVAQMHPSQRADVGLVVEPPDPDVLSDRCDVVFLATPAPVSADLAVKLADRVSCVIDLSGAFRIHSPELHHRWYPTVDRDQALAERFLYGVPELVGDRMGSASLISNPGCYATAITLGLAPLSLELGLRLDRVVVDGKSGSSGGGLHLRTADLHPFRNGAISPYSPAGHRHAGEVSEFLQTCRPGSVGRISMSAYGVSTVRGLLVSCYVPVEDGEVDERALSRAYLRFYRGHRFVRVRRHTETVIPVPDPQAVSGSNFCDVTAIHDPEGGRVVVLAALDNLVKGAAGQAVQAMNRRFGQPEETGLTMGAVAPA